MDGIPQQTTAVTAARRRQQVSQGIADGGAQGTAFSGVQPPTALSGLVGFWRADAGVTLNSGNISALGDQSGTGNHVVNSTAGEQPAWTASGGPNNLPFITFASNRQLKVDLNAGLKPASLTVFTVFRMNSFSAYQTLLNTASGPAWQNGWGTGQVVTLSGHTGGFVNTYDGTPVDVNVGLGNWIVLVQRYDGTNLKIWVNGVLSGTKAFAGPIVHATSGKLVMGASIASVTPTYAFPLTGDVTHVGVYGRALSDMEVGQVTRWLASQTKLPVTL